VKTKVGHFEPSKFEDQYEDALKELLKKKQEGKPIERPEQPKPTNVVNLMDALRRSVALGCLLAAALSLMFSMPAPNVTSTSFSQT
jgi:non-homologous end joining protein Ku